MSEKQTKEDIEPAFEPEETYTKSLCLGGGPSLPMRVDAKNGKVIRVRPLHFDEKYSLDHIRPWKIEARGKTFNSYLKSMPNAYSSAYKKRVYSPTRILYPLKRVDWDLNGERNPQNRGKSKYVRISWDEATDIIASEIKRIQETYGPFAILCQGDEAGHSESKTVHKAHGCQKWLLRNYGNGDYTLQVRNPDSVEGWYWGAKYVWGDMFTGQMAPQANCLKDISEHTEMILYWGADPETTPCEKIPSAFSLWFRELGIKRVFVTPDMNYAAAVHADKWIPVLPNTDAALFLAIAYVWLTEGTYDKEYVATHTFGIEKFEEYVMGKEDGIPKTPAWASSICGVNEWTIYALAEQWASKITSIVQCGGGGLIRGPYSHEPARLEILLLAMQGIGKPGVHQSFPHGGIPVPSIKPDVNSAMPFGPLPFMKQLISKVYIHKAILNPPISHWGTSFIFIELEDQWVKHTYPIPEEEGGTRIRMMWNDHPSWVGNWNGGNLMVKAWRDPSIECVVAQHPWLENDCLYADIILPTNTIMEEDDIMASTMAGNYSTIYRSPKAIEPIGESKSDYEAVGEVAKKLGIYEEYTGGRTIEEKIKLGYEKSGAKNLVSWEELNEKGYYVVSTNPNWEKDPAGMYNFYKDPEGNPVHTKSGKIEFYAQWLVEHFPDDKERGPVPHWISGGPGWTHDESMLGERAKKYPLLVISNHPRWRHHVQCDDETWIREIPTCKIKGPDGYLYEPVWIHPTEAAKRGIKHYDIIKLFNERGTVLGAAYVTERVIPGAIMQDHGARTDEILSPGIERGGNHNMIAPDNIISPHATGQATNNFLVEIAKVETSEMEEWKEKYPEAFKRAYDPAAGLVFSSWVEEGEE